MKILNLVAFFTLTLAMCIFNTDIKVRNEGSTVHNFISKDTSLTTFGAPIKADNAQSIERMSSRYKNLKIGDTVSLKLHAKVKEVCQAKGCWMTLDLANNNEVMVKFKDYGFFVPKDISGREVIVSGIAFVEEISVDEQRHYATDEGKSEIEIALITEPKNTFMFIAEGVLIKPD